MHTVSSGDMIQQCYENEVPEFAESELERLYGSMFSSLAHFRIYGGAENASTYVARKGKEIVTIFLFRREKNKIRIINEWMQISVEEIARFSNFIFGVFHSATMIVFHAIEPKTQNLGFPFQRFICGENIVVTLPATPEDYLASIGSSTRKNLKRHRNRLQRDFPSFSFQVFEREEADDQHIREIVAFNRARMAIKSKVSALDEKATEDLIALVRQRGIVMVAMIDGRVCAGTIAFRFGKNFVSRVNAHDPRYDDYRLGMICCYLGICECISRGGEEFHFMWGKYEYKTALLGIHRNLEDLLIYRSNPHFVLNGHIALKAAIAAHSREAKSRLMDRAERDDSPFSHFLNRSLKAAKIVKRLGAFRPVVGLKEKGELQ